jgi:hypothetical protein
MPLPDPLVFIKEGIEMDDDRSIAMACFGAVVGLVLSLWFLVAYYGGDDGNITSHVSDRPDMFADFPE